MKSESDKRVIAVRDPRVLMFKAETVGQLEAVLPLKYKYVDTAQTHLCVTPHTDDAVKVLRNIGYQAPGCIRNYYKWCGMYSPRAVQVDTAEFLSLHRRAYCLNSMGTGKTISTLWALDYLRSQGAVKRALVVAPLSTLRMTWGNEILQNFPHLDFQVLHGSRQQRLALLKEKADIYIVNHDGLRIIADDLARRDDIDLVVLDETSVYKNASTARWKVTNEVVNKQCKGRRRVWGLTGTPTPNAPTDAFAQVKLITPAQLERYNVRSLTAFKNVTMTQFSTYRWEPKPNASEFTSRVMQPSIRYTLDECVELPEQVFLTQAPEMSSKQERAYKALKEKLAAEIDGESVTAVNAAVLYNKLLQVSCGAVYSDVTAEDEDNARNVTILEPHARLDAMVEVVHESESKVIIFVPFKHSMTLVKEKLDKEGIGYVIVTGGTSGRNRDKAFTAFKHEAEIKVLLAQPQTMSHGLTLTEASTIIWFGLTTSNETFEQANARVRRPGQKRKTAIVAFTTTSAEKKLLTALRKKQEGQHQLLTLLQEEVL